MKLHLFLLRVVIAVSSCSGSSLSSKWTLFVNGSIYIDADRKVSNLLVRDGVVVGADMAKTNSVAFDPFGGVARRLHLLCSLGQRLRTKSAYAVLSFYWRSSFKTWSKRVIITTKTLGLFVVNIQ